MNLLKRTLAMMLVLCMMLSMAPVTAFASESTDVPGEAAGTVVDAPISENPSEDSEDKTPAVDNSDTNEPGNGEIDTNEPGTGEADTNEPGNGEIDTNEPGAGEADTNEPGTGEADTNEPAADEPGANEPDTNAPGLEEGASEDTSEEEEMTEEEETDNMPVFLSDAEPANITDFIRAFALDCGRLYFSVQDIKEIIDVMDKNGYTHLTLAFGNSGFRFLLDDMTIGEYSSNKVKSAIQEGNSFYVKNDGHNGSSAPNTCLTQADMDSIIAYANKKGIEIIPALNSPGHMNTIVYAMETLGIENAGYPVTSSYNSESTLNIENEEVLAFVSELIQKYITYFDGKDCTMFNLGADEFANDPTDEPKLQVGDAAPGFASMSVAQKDSFINYVNRMANMVSNAGMIPMMFNDGYHWSDAKFNKDIIVCYWTPVGVSSTAIAAAGHNVINNSSNYYYVLGEPFGTASGSWCSYASATNGATNVPVTTMVDNGDPGEKLVGSQMFLWCDFTDETYTATEESRVHTLIATLAENNPGYFNISEEPEGTETRYITVHVNQTVTDTIENVAVSGDCTTEDSAIATAVAETYQTTVPKDLDAATNTNPIISGEKYLIISGYGTGNKALSGTAMNQKENDGIIYDRLALDGGRTVDNPNLWTITQEGDYYYFTTDSGEYLTFDLNTAGTTSNKTKAPIQLQYVPGKGAWTLYNAATKNYLTDNHLAGISANGYTSADDSAYWTINRLVDESSTGTRVKFTGHKVGETVITVGNVTYNVTVVEEDLSAVELIYHPWLSTYAVFPEGYEGELTANQPRNVTISAAREGVNTAEGVAMTDLADPTGDWIYEGNEEDGIQTYYWKATVLPEGSWQEGVGDHNMSMSGTDFKYIRYLDGVWAYSADRVTWTAVKDTDEVCAYYLQKTEVTTEVDTYVADWAYSSKTIKDDADKGRYKKALSFAAVYPGGTLNPSEETIYDLSTLIYYDNLKHLGFIRFGIDNLYEVEKITYTLGYRDTTGKTEDEWSEDETLVWNKATVGDVTWFDETICWEPSYGTEPVINGEDLLHDIYPGNSSDGDPVHGTYFDGSWGVNDAVLILIYVKPVVTEDSLEVIYIDEKFNEELYRYNINVNSSVDDVSTFKTDIGKVSNVNGTVTIDTNNQPGQFADNAARIDVTGYGITNNLNVIQSFQTDLTKVPDAHGKYNSELYKYTGSEISEDGKTLYLYYNIDTTVLSPNYVVDFGLPITFGLEKLLGEGTEVDDVEKVGGLSARYGDLTYNDKTNVFTYTPTSILQGIDVLSIALTMGGKTSTTNVGVTPATTVYYGEKFLTFDSGWDTEGESANVPNQKTEVLGDSSYYGYDDAYSNQAGASDGTAMKSETIGDAATFTFTGTGIQVFANSAPNSGYASVIVKNKETGAVAKVAMVDTVVTGTYETDTTGGQVGKNLNGLPIVSLVDLTGLDHDTYEVTISKVMDTDPVYIDGIRVFGTVDESKYEQNNNPFTADEEDAPNFFEVRDLVMKAIDISVDESADYDTLYQQVYANTVEVGASAVITYAGAEDGTLDRQDLLDNGPKNELYLFNGDTLTMNVSTNRVIQLGLKAPEGSASFTLNGESKNLNTTVDMFYKIAEKGGTTHTITVTNTGEEILSVTLLKICDDPNVTFPALTEDNIKDILADAGITENPVEPETPSEPEKPTYTLVELKGTDVLIDGTVFDYTGSPIEPAITVNVDGKELVAGRDYSVTYMNNVEPGTATVIVRGIATASETMGYTGEIKIDYTIKAPAVKYADATLKVKLVDYTGKVLATGNIVANGKEQDTAVFTAAVILETVNKNLPKNYSVADKNAISDVEVQYGNSDEITIKIGKTATLNITYISLLGRKVGTAKITVVQTAKGYCYISASQINAQAPGNHRGCWLLPAMISYGTTSSITVPVF